MVALSRVAHTRQREGVPKSGRTPIEDDSTVASSLTGRLTCMRLFQNVANEFVQRQDERSQRGEQTHHESEHTATFNVDAVR